MFADNVRIGKFVMTIFHTIDTNFYSLLKPCLNMLLIISELIFCRIDSQNYYRCQIIWDSIFVCEIFGSQSSTFSSTIFFPFS